MKKHFIYGLIIIAGVLYSVSCQKSEPIAPESEQQETTPEVTPEDAKPSGPVYITATIPDDGISSKVSFESFKKDDDTWWKRTWEVGDNVSVNGTIFTVQSVAENGTATLYSETAPDPDEANSYTITYGSFSNSQTRYTDGDATGLSIFSLSGVRDYKAITFSSAWAEENGGAYSESGVLYLRTKMPDGIAATVKQVKITAVDSEGNPNNLFGEDNEVTVTFEKPGDKEGNGILDIFVNLYSPTAQNVEGTSLLVRFSTEADTDNADFRYTRYYTFASDIALKPGKVNRLSLNCAETASHAGSPTADGATVANAYLIGDKYQLAAVNGLLASETKYFKLIADIDMEGVSWTTINPEKSPWNPINLDGNGKTISNLGNSLFYVFKGSAKDLTLKNCDATDGTHRGIFAQYIQGAGEHKVSNVDVLGGTVQAGNGNMGGLVGRINNPSGGTTTATITGCDVKNTKIIGKSTGTGGLIGLVESAITVTNTSITGTSVTGNDGAVALGGIVGKVTSASSFSNCTFEKGDGSTAKVTGPSKTGEACSEVAPGNIYIGGIAGEVSGAASFDDCHVKNATLTVTNPTENKDYWKNVGGAFGYIHNANAKVGNTTACTVENITVPAYHFAAGFVSAVNGGTIENSTVTGLTISGQNYVGGFVSIINSGTIEGCSVAGAPITNANATVSGFAAYIYGSATLKGNSTSLQIGDAEHLTATNNGGFAGQVIAAARIENCSASGDVYASGNYVGGFAGYVTNGTFISCYASGAVSSGSSRVGGLLGAVTLATVSKCSATGDVNGDQYVGGIIGQALPANNTTISVSESYYSKGTVSATNYAGGIVGITYKGGDTGTLTITNCYMAGDVSVSGMWAGGILGSHYMGMATLENCYDTGSVTGPIGVGGIVGYVNANGLSVTRCFPFNSLISATNTDGNQHQSSGAVVAYGKNKTMVVDWCYRISDMASKFNDCTGNAVNVIEQHPFIKTMAVIPQRKNLTNGYYHHGRNTNYSLSNLVHSGAIGEDWSNTIWDWSGSRPVLINNKETLE